MLSFFPIDSKKEIERTSPLHVSAFFSLTRMSWKKRKLRQALILSIATGWWHKANKNLSAPGFELHDFFLTSLSAQDKESRKVLDYFFTVVQVGFNMGNGSKQSSKLQANKLPGTMVAAIINFLQDAQFDPGPPPKVAGLTSANVTIKCTDVRALKRQLDAENKEHLLPAVDWLLAQKGQITFFYEAAGSLKARDKSVWPIKSIETWPGWLRKELFGDTIDIKNAYFQFLLQQLRTKYADCLDKLELMYPDLVKIDADSSIYRNELCSNYLMLKPTKDNIKYVKRLIMSLSNGSRISGRMLQTFNTNSDAVAIVIEANSNLTNEQMVRLGDKLGSISKQIKSAKKDICRMRGLKGSAADQKRIFPEYLGWEKDVRQKLWVETSSTGLNAHDGLDGANIKNPTEFPNNFYKKYGVKVNVDCRDIVMNY